MSKAKPSAYQAERYRPFLVDENGKKESMYGSVEKPPEPDGTRRLKYAGTQQEQNVSREAYAQNLLRPTSSIIRENMTSRGATYDAALTEAEVATQPNTRKKYGYRTRKRSLRHEATGSSEKNNSRLAPNGGKKTLKLLNQTTSHAVMATQDEDSPATKTVNTYGRTRRTIQVSKSVAVGAKKAATKATSYVRAVWRSAGESLFSNPLVTKGISTASLIVLVLAIFLGAITAVTSIVPSISFKSENKEMTRAYRWITALDADLSWTLHDLLPPEDPNGDTVCKIYVNGYEASPKALNIRTDPDLLLLYCDVKFGDYVFDGVLYGIATGTTTISAHLGEIHKEMYSFEQFAWYETVEVGVDEATGEPITKEIYRYDLCITVVPFEELLQTDERYALNKEQLAQYEILKSVGIYTVKAELGSLFLDQAYYVTDRWGDYYDETQASIGHHKGIDLFIARGTPVNNALYGTVSNTTANSVTITHGSRELRYVGLESVEVQEGQLLERGDIVGSAGRVPESGLSGLHLEYYIEDGYETNPAFFLADLYIAGTGKGDENIVSVAADQIGSGGETYWSWYGFDARVSWCACFVSWCANECGYIESGIIPKFSYCPDGDQWFQERGLWQPNGGSYVPKAGDIIFFDYERNGESNHVGIVSSCDGSIVYTIEGNAADQCRQREYSIYDVQIMGYGTPTYSLAETEGD